MCVKETYKVLFSKAVVKTYICSKISKGICKPVKGFRVKVQEKLKEKEEWLD